MLYEGLTHMLVDRLSECDLVISLLQFLLEVLYFALLGIEFLLKLHVVVTHSIFLLL